MSSRQQHGKAVHQVDQKGGIAMMKFPRRWFLKGAAVAGAAVTAASTADPAAAKPRPGGGEPTVKQPVTTNVPPGQERYFDTYYHVVRGQVPASYHPWVANREDRVLLYTRTAGPRHAHLGPALPAGMNP